MDVFLEMEPGIDGLPWVLCAACWIAYLKNEGSLTAVSGRVLEVAPLASPVIPERPKRRGRSGP